MKAVIKWVLIIIAGLVVLGAIFGNPSSQPTHTVAAAASAPAAAEQQATPAADAAPVEEQAIKVAAKALAKAYDENEAAADSQYKGKLLHVSGTITGIKKDFSDDTVVELAGSDEFLSVQGVLTEQEAAKAVTMKKGQTVVLACQGGGEVVSIPMLTQCAVL